MSAADNYLELNRRLWNAKTDYHMQSAFYNVAGFRAGESSLNEVELGLLGDVAGQQILHLQCHFGLDTMSLSRLGGHVTGVDLADAAIDRARSLAAELQLDTQFICADVYALPQHLHQQFDVVFTTFGVLGWLPDMQQWAAVVAQFLKPGGRLILVEFHPVVWMFDPHFTRIEYAYFNRETITETEVGTYAEPTAPIQETAVSWNHSLGEVVGALLGQGLALDHFEEYDYSPYNCFAGLEQVAERRYQLSALPGKLPLMYSVVARKKH
ncbi:class I SAM-dependent methyltransferase [Hymenobacter metallilatus]|uniref:Class I SAM-dependent methyltransferase n=1 Tax=Hymenobacter metallilatus TaxID=2493666 RepID=A0A3R9PCS5_9BACT|nr:class I SAM-dependent methyltransferase [Hymenobacter metallilatus]RSK34020.1 class I SAM-dependent methyltransferase [Hymenobacter metallilatus]